MNKENKRKNLFFTLSISILLLVLSIICFVPTTMVAKADTSGEARDRFFETTFDDLSSNASGLYYDKTIENTSNSGVLSDSIYNWDTGAFVETNDINKMSFSLNLNNPSYEVINTSNGTDRSAYRFGIYKCSDDGVSSVKLADILIYNMNFYFTESNTNKTLYFNSTGLGIKQYVYGDETFSVFGYDKNFTADMQERAEYANTAWIKDLPIYSEVCNYLGVDSLDTHLGNKGHKSCEIFMNSEYDIVSWNATFAEDDDSIFNRQLGFGDLGVYKKFFITLANVDSYSHYYINFDYRLDHSAKQQEFGSIISTKIASQYDILYSIDGIDGLSVLDDSQQDKAEEIVYTGSMKEINVSYLTEIEGTTFATKKYVTVKVPLLHGEVRPYLVAEALGLDSLDVMQSHCQYFMYDKDTDTYNAYYLEGVYLSAMDVNGNYARYTLSVNLSYREYYYGFVENGVFSNGMYNWFWSQMINDYPLLSPYMDYEIYGYFGFVTIPNVYSLNSVWASMFTDTSFSGIVNYVSYVENLSLSSYNKLLEDYGYSWLGIVWNDFMSLFDDNGATANNYMFYVSDTASKAYIGENGADDFYDNSGAIVNGVEDIGEAIVSFFDIDGSQYILGFIMLMLLIVVFAPMLPNLLTVIGKFFLLVLKGIWYIISAPFKLIAKAFKGRKR